MILQALYDYYERKSLDLPKQGYENKDISFTIVINENGDFVNLEDNRVRKSDKSNKLVGKPYLIPKARPRSSTGAYKYPNYLWDHYGYVLCQAKPDYKNEAEKEKNEELARLQFENFRILVAQIAKDTQDTAVKAVEKFLSKSSEIEKVKKSDLYSEVLKIKGCNLVFKLNTQNYLVCQTKLVQQWVANQNEKLAYDKNNSQSVCLITGKKGYIARLHLPVNNICEKKAPFASCNKRSSESYNKTQAFNFPTSDEAVFKYTTALNDLLKRDANCNFHLGKTTVIFWSQKPSKLEGTCPFLLGRGDKKEDPNKLSLLVKEFYESINKGSLDYLDKNNLFYVLGLSPNAQRIVVRFWYTGTVESFSKKIKDWFDDIKIVKSNSEEGYVQYGLPSLIKSLLSNKYGDNQKEDPKEQIFYDMAVKAIFSGQSLPLALYQATLQNNQFQERFKFIGRVALIKAYINRKFRRDLNTKERIKVKLDNQEQNIGYCLGRLFAIYEKLQLDSAGGSLSSSICDTYFGSASRTPQFVYPILNRLHNYHLRKLDSKKQNYFERLIGNVMQCINNFPAHLNLEEQGFFAIGYYHQKEDFYTKKANKQEE